MRAQRGDCGFGLAREHQIEKGDVACLARRQSYGRGRSLNSDGARNHTRISANLDCERGQYEKGIAVMEDLLRKKAFAVPAPTDVVPTLKSPEYGS